MSERVARSRELVAAGLACATVARVMQVSQQALYRVLARRPSTAGPPSRARDKVEQAIVSEALVDQTERPRVTGLHRELVRETERTGGLNEYETLDDACRGIGSYVER